MASDIILPKPQEPVKPKPILVPVASALKGQADLILKNAGLALLKPRFFVIDRAKMTEELSVDDPQHPFGPDGTSVFGTPIFDTITFNELTYTDFNEKEISLGSFTLEIALFEIDLPRNIVKTPVAGRNGTVKEYMSDDDYQIKITGSLVNPVATLPPEQLIRALHQYCKAQTEIKVNSSILAYLDIFTIVIERPKFIQRAGYRNVFDFELQCVSDTPFEIKSATS